MASIETRIQQAAAKNKELLRVIADTEHAVPSLAQQNRFIAELEAGVQVSDKRVQAIDRKRKKEFYEHEKYRDSVLKRFAYKATGKKEKFEARAQKEETEYFEALQEEHRESEMNKNLKEQLQAARRAGRDLEKEVERHNQMQQELDKLYDALFAGPTPGFPEEDDREQATNRAISAYQDARSRAEAEFHAVRLLGEGQERMRSALAAMDEALSHSRRDMFGGGSMSDMMERNALHRAEMDVAGARMANIQAQRMSPQVGMLPNVEISQGSLMSDVLFDNIFTDMAFHDRIKASREQVERAARAMDELAAGAMARHRELHHEFEMREAELQSARAALQKARERAFERVERGEGRS
ncbi:hypothetical protein B0H63DRAFT_319562 [Podospora didyma]|uniref:Uncharacterized protein n=1 Tax=Podospora didyma TaxID=330526 RepID=A0AAE0K6U8_9PEZI|nr:hypothetical protein B0H63DRAFT_319562 [Podospora didyma]